MRAGLRGSENLETFGDPFGGVATLPGAMSIKFLLGSVVAAAAVFAIPNVSQAGTQCKSNWVKASAQVNQFFLPAGRLACTHLNTDNEAQAKKCIEDLEKFAGDAAKIKEQWNKGATGSWKIGPRGLPHNRTQAGKVATERQFVGQPVTSEDYSITIKRTGGKAKNDMIIKVCMIDEDGNDAKGGFKQARLSKKGKKTATFTFKGVPGTMALVHLNNQKWGTNAHQYTIETKSKGDSAAVATAKKVAAKAKSKPKSKSKSKSRSKAPGPKKRGR